MEQMKESLVETLVNAWQNEDYKLSFKFKGKSNLTVKGKDRLIAEEEERAYVPIADEAGTSRK